MHPRTPQPLAVLLMTFALAAGCGEVVEDTAPEIETASANLTAAECLGAAEDRRVTFCHATGSATNPYVTITVSTNACIQAHTGHGGDVLPDSNGACCPVEEQDCNGVCGGTAEVDCAGVCGGGAIEDCAGTCEGTAELDCAGTCEGAAVEDCAGTCNGAAEFDCAGTCGGTAEEVDVVHFTTNGGVFRWTTGAPSSAPAQVSTFPSYALAVSPLGEVFVGTGGLEATAQGLGTAGIYALDSAGAATLVSATAAEDLQFSPDGDLHAANRYGIYIIDEATGLATQRSSNPTSQFAFDSSSTVVTTNGTAYGSIFTRRTDRINLTTGTTTLLNGDGGEDIKVDDGVAFLCGQGGIFEVLPSGALSRIYSGRTFNFGIGQEGDLFVGNSTAYAGIGWPTGFYAPAISSSALSTHDINALVVTAACE